LLSCSGSPHDRADRVAPNLGRASGPGSLRSSANPGPESELHAYISNFFIVPAERNSGVGTKILSAAVAHCRAHHVDTVFLWPTQRSTPLYQRTGFEIPADLLVLELREGKPR
jgi:GNAT superfamily N-acetyltransferase